MMLAMAKERGVMTHKRSPEYQREKTESLGEVVRHVAENVEGTHILWATCTAPLVFPKVYRSAINEYFPALEAGYDSLVSFEVIKRYLWDENGPVNYELGIKHVPSQQLPNLYIVTDGILLAPREKMIEWSYFMVEIRIDLYQIKERQWIQMMDQIQHVQGHGWIWMNLFHKQIHIVQML